MTVVRMEPYAARADDEIALMFTGSNGANAGKPLGIGFRLVYDCGARECENPDHGRALPLLDLEMLKEARRWRSQRPAR